MARVPESVAEFLRGKRFAVAGVSRQRDQAANAVYRKLRDCGFAVYAINPNATEVEGTTCYRDIGSLPERIDGVVIATHPQAAVDLIRQCAEHGVPHAWFHRSFGEGSVSEAAVREGAALGVKCIVGGCPLMYCAPVDLGHRCMRWWLRRQGRVPG